ncbi:MAG: hypothetical protein IPK68_20365 [Bdellovibrionales bacterium]|nr:hypothetical protein [Bdellovibrionales bacterium]
MLANLAGDALISWIDEELSRSKFSDKRIGKRLIKIVQQLAAKMGNGI